MKYPIYISQDRKYKPVNITLFVIVSVAVMGLFVGINENFMKQSKPKQNIMAEIKERYFIVSYVANSIRGQVTGQINITSKTGSFISRSKVVNVIENKLIYIGGKETVITFIMEINKAELDDWTTE